MKVTIEIDNEEQALTVMQGPYYKYVLNDVDTYLRNEMKYNTALTQDQVLVLEKAREYLFDRSADVGISID